MDFGGGRQNRRDELEIGSDGKTTAENKRRRQQEQQRDMQDMQSGKSFGRSKRGLKGRFARDRGRNNRGSESSGGCLTQLAGLALVAVPIVIVVMLFTGNLKGVWRSAFSSSEQNLASFYQGVFNTEQAAKDSLLTEAEQEEVSFYRKNMISSTQLIDKQVYPEYIVFIYSDDEEKNKPYVDYIEEAELRKDYPVPIYRISADKTEDYFVTDSLGVNEPGLAIYRNNTGDVEYDSVIGDPKHLGKLEDYVKELLAEDDEFFKNNRGSYGEVEWLQHISDRVNSTPNKEDFKE